MHKLEQRVTDYLEAHPQESFKTKELSRRIGLAKQGDAYQDLKKTLRSLQQQDIIERIDGRKWRLKPLHQTLRGSLHITPQGNGIVEVDSVPSREIYINRDGFHTAIDGDEVEVAIFATKKGQHDGGEIISITSRRKKTVVGVVKKVGRFMYIKPDGRALNRDIALTKKELHGAQEDDKVVVELDEWTDEWVSPRGKVTEVLGKAGEPNVEIQAIARRHNFDIGFSREVLEEAEAIASEISDEELPRRLDLREENCFTIDPVDAKDFDDAISIHIDEEGDYHLGVHIADVSHFVQQGSALDQEAYRRGTSVYLVNSVIPMLPERLSNELCSLKENEDRLTYSILVTLISDGSVKDYSFHKSIIKSKKRFTYEEVESIIQSQSGLYLDTLQRMNSLAKLLMKRRTKEGSIDFEVPEVKFIFDEIGRPKDIVAKPRLQSMRIVEEFMLLANKLVATHINHMNARVGNYPFLYRVHDFPDPEKVKELKSFLEHRGLEYHLNPRSSKSFQKMLASVRGKEEEGVINDITIRSMAKAVYSEKNIGHFGLAFKHYSHFTSPIRRYPDVIVHRLLDEYENSGAIRASKMSSTKLSEIARHSSKRERDAIEAERESVKIKQVEYMKRHLGAEFAGVINGVAPYGLFIELIPTLVEGMIHIRVLEGDYFTFDEKQKELIGKRTKKKYRVGDKVRVKVIRVDSYERRIDFMPVE